MQNQQSRTFTKFENNSLSNFQVKILQNDLIKISNNPYASNNQSMVTSSTNLNNKSSYSSRQSTEMLQIESQLKMTEMKLQLAQMQIYKQECMPNNT